MNRQPLLWRAVRTTSADNPAGDVQASQCDREQPTPTFFLLDSLFPRQTWSQGELGADQIQWLARELEARPGQAAIVNDSRTIPQFNRSSRWQTRTRHLPTRGNCSQLLDASNR